MNLTASDHHEFSGLTLFSTEKKSYECGDTWGWVNDHIIFSLKQKINK